MPTPKELVHTYMETVWVQQEFARLNDFVSPDLIQHNPNLPHGREALRGFLPVLFQELMPGLQWRVARIIAEGDMVAVHSHATSTGQPLGMAVVDIFRVADGKIAEHWDVSQPIPEQNANGSPVV